jgi:hypothetical protein
MGPGKADDAGDMQLRDGCIKGKVVVVGNLSVGYHFWSANFSSAAACRSADCTAGTVARGFNSP